jgi:hypothetical protein
MFMLFLVFVALLAGVNAKSTYSEVDAIFHVQFARAAFCTQAAIETWTCGEMCDAIKPPPLNVRFLPRGDWWSVQGYVAQMQDQHCILAFRGSVDVQNWAADMMAVPRPWPQNGTKAWCANCSAHAGFAMAYDELRPGVLNAISDFSCKSIGVVGHSLGGGLATLAALDLSAGRKMDVYPVYTFGSPRVGNFALVSAFEEAGKENGHVPAQWRITHYHDPVPHLAPPIPAMGSLSYEHTPTEVWYNLPSSSYRVCDANNGEDPTCSASVSSYELVNFQHLTYFNKTFAHKKMERACTGVGTHAVAETAKPVFV